jgi:hypothetical protein
MIIRWRAGCVNCIVSALRKSRHRRVPWVKFIGVPLDHFVIVAEAAKAIDIIFDVCLCGSVLL